MRDTATATIRLHVLYLGMKGPCTAPIMGMRCACLRSWDAQQLPRAGACRQHASGVLHGAWVVLYGECEGVGMHRTVYLHATHPLDAYRPLKKLRTSARMPRDIGAFTPLQISSTCSRITGKNATLQQVGSPIFTSRPSRALKAWTLYLIQELKSFSTP